VLAVLLLASGLKLLGAPDAVVLGAAAAAVVFAFVAWELIRNRVRRAPAEDPATTPLPPVPGAAPEPSAPPRVVVAVPAGERRYRESDGQP
jgi:hypothetical protein